LYSCSCPDSSKLCKCTFLVNHIIQVPFTGRPRLHVTPATDKNAALSNTTEEMSNDAFGKIQSTSNMDERSLRFSEFINEGEKYCQVINRLWKEKSVLLTQQGRLNEMSLLVNALKEAATAVYDVRESSCTL
ncbi:hypothetical protein BCV72DRAFT_193484, partial [Rhizopus microsporus var. microsporus]